MQKSQIKIAGASKMVQDVVTRVLGALKGTCRVIDLASHEAVPLFLYPARAGFLSGQYKIVIKRRK